MYPVYMTSSVTVLVLGVGVIANSVCVRDVTSSNHIGIVILLQGKPEGTVCATDVENQAMFSRTVKLVRQRVWTVYFTARSHVFAR